MSECFRNQGFLNFRSLMEGSRDGSESVQTITDPDLRGQNITANRDPDPDP
jgi:hypothetical protein